MPGIAYQIRLGALLCSSDPRSTQAQLLGLRCTRPLSGAGAACIVDLAPLSGRPPDPGAVATMSLQGDGNGSAVAVFSGTVTAVATTPSVLRITAGDGLSVLARRHTEASYEGVSADFIIRDILQDAQLTAGSIPKGPTFPRYYLHRAPSLLAHLSRLADLCGAQIFCDAEGRIQILPLPGGPVVHPLRFGQDLLGLDLTQVAPPTDGVICYGEGAASARGAERAHALPVDLASVTGKAALAADRSIERGKLGSHPRAFSSGAIRSGEDAAMVASTMLARLASRPIQGSALLPLAPQVQPTDRVQIQGMPASHPAAPLCSAPLRVITVHHALDLARGATTRLEF